MKNIKRALISVSDKTGIVQLIQGLHQLDIEILSTGGTAELIEKHGIPVVKVSDYTQFPEIMHGRLKTLHPKIHGGILGRRDLDNEVMKLHAIEPIDMVVVNLYPFKKTVNKDNVNFDEAIDNIDIGGPAMLRSAAKNHRDVVVVSDPKDYEYIIQELNTNGGFIGNKTRFSLAVKTFEHTAEYDGMIANYLGTLSETTKKVDNRFPNTINLQFTRKQKMRYGENPHQSAALYINKEFHDISVIRSDQIQGKELSYNNIADADTALECVLSFKRPTCVIVKHANPCGIATDSNLLDAYRKALKCDPISAFGGIIALNSLLDKNTANEIISNQFSEVIIAENVSLEAKQILNTKKNIRVLVYGKKKKIQVNAECLNNTDIKSIAGGLLAQDKNTHQVEKNSLRVVTKSLPTERQMEDLIFAWKVVKLVKSNAVVYAKDNCTLGIGAGQMSRVFSSKIALDKASEAGLDTRGSVMASDAFFPFRDSIDKAISSGVKAIIQPGGSVRDQEILDAANEHDIVMVFTGVRYFRH
jgi:phosphoribosylaminoimidazolecarboxamide formyltransferase/IMP cyclohydrolase